MTQQTVMHGSVDFAELRRLGIAPGDVLDFSASIGPLGTPPAVREAIARVDPSRYPDRNCTELREALASHLSSSPFPSQGKGRDRGLPEATRVTPDHILAGNGSTELIHLAARALLNAGARAVIFPPTFGEYASAASNQKAAISEMAAPATDVFPGGLLSKLRTLKPALTFLCNPNNPTGVLLGAAAVRALAQAVRPGYLVVDEAYMPLADVPWDSVPLLAQENIILLRSMTKDFGLAGVRLGYVLANPEVVLRMRRLQPTWTVSSVAQAAGLAALRCGDHLLESRRIIAEGKAYLRGELAALGLPPNASTANFFLIDVGNGAALRAKLLQRRVLVRECASFGLPAHIRVAVRSVEDCSVLVQALREVRAIG